MGDADQPGPQRPAVGLALRALEVPVGLEEGLLGQVLGVVVVADPVVASRSRRRAGGRGRAARRRGRARPCAAAARLVARSARRSSLCSSQPPSCSTPRRSCRAPGALGPAQAAPPTRPRSMLALDQRGEARRGPAASTPARVDGLGDQRHRVEALRGLADPLRDLVGGDAAAEQLAGPAVAAAGGEDRRGQVADPGEAGEGLELGAARASRSRRTRARPRRRRSRRRSARAARRRRRRARRRSWRRRPSRRRRRRRCARRQAGPVEDLAELGAQVGVGAGRGRARRCPDAASLAWAGPPRQAIARARTRSATYSVGSAPSGGDQALGEQQHGGAAADPVAERADRGGQRRRGDGEADEVAGRRARSRRRA